QHAVTVELQQGSPTASRGPAASGLDHVAVLDQVAYGRGHRGLRVPGGLGELGARHRAVLEQGADHTLETSEPLRSARHSRGHRRHAFFIACSKWSSNPGPPRNPFVTGAHPGRHPCRHPHHLRKSTHSHHLKPSLTSRYEV